jgi:hypothetical protein
VKNGKGKPPTDDCLIPPKLSHEALQGNVLGQTEHENQHVIDYMAGQARDETVTHVEKIRTERVMGRNYGCFDVHTDKGRWWVITSPTNLYSHEHFLSLGYTLSFHIGITLRVFAHQQLSADQSDKDRLPNVLRKWEQAARANEEANEPEDFQAVGMKCRECLIALVRALAEPEMVPAGTEEPKAGDFKQWAGLIADTIAKGSSASQVRGYLKGLAEAAWPMVSWLTHAANAARDDGHLAVTITRHVLDAFLLALVRFEAGAPERCPNCTSYQLVSVYRPDLELDPPYVTLCQSCGWVSLPEQDEAEEAET